MADHTPAVDDGNVEGIDAADHVPAVDDGHVKGTDAAGRAPTVDDSSQRQTQEHWWEYQGRQSDPALDHDVFGDTEGLLLKY
ncbi:hypothetical protein BU17DRAFT_97923 [Hysterangium stoloniferum]|nr:hypothetical protein BU17DRAFT_97923 [Hysterangium stoloniferum]